MNKDDKDHLIEKEYISLSKKDFEDEYEIVDIEKKYEGKLLIIITMKDAKSVIEVRKTLNFLWKIFWKKQKM